MWSPVWALGAEGRWLQTFHVSYITQSRLNKTGVKSHDLMLQWLYFLSCNPFICMCVYSQDYSSLSLGWGGERMFETFCKGFAISSGLLSLRIQCVSACAFMWACECLFVWAFSPPPFCCFYAKTSHMVAFRSSFTAEVFQTLMNGSLVT